MANKLYYLLQLFADGAAGDGGTGAGAADGAEATVDTAADDGRARLLALGVPESALREGRNYSPRRNRNGEQRQAAAANGTTPNNNEGRANFTDWLNSNPDYKAEHEAIIQKRVAKYAQDHSDMDALRPSLAKYLSDNGLPEDTDMATLARHMNGEYRDKAMELGVSEQTAMEMDARERRAQEESFRKRVEELTQQANEFRAIVPDFDLNAELQSDELFRKLTGPDIGMSVEQAYWALHHSDMAGALMQATQAKATQMVSNAIRSGSMRPSEYGASSFNPSTMKEKSYRDMTPAERIAFKKARGLPV